MKIKLTASSDLYPRQGPLPAALGSLAAAKALQVSPISGPSKQLSAPGAHWSISFHSAGYRIVMGTSAGLHNRLKGSSPACALQTWPPGGWCHIPSIHSKLQRHLCSNLSHTTSPLGLSFLIHKTREGDQWYSNGGLQTSAIYQLCCWLATR